MIFYQIELFQKNKSIECIIYERVNLKKCISVFKLELNSQKVIVNLFEKVHA